MMYHLLHAGMARETPLPLRHDSWPLQRQTSILHITNVSFASASVCPSRVIALKCVSHTLVSCVTGKAVWFGLVWHVKLHPPSQPLWSPFKWHWISTVAGKLSCHFCVCHLFFPSFWSFMHSFFIWTFFLCLSVHCAPLSLLHVFVVSVYLHPSATSGISSLLWNPPERGLGMVTCFLPRHS